MSETPRDSAIKKWISGARQRPLPAAIAPVRVGTALRGSDHHAINLVKDIWGLAVVLPLQQP